jgi:hypothetical protein
MTLLQIFQQKGWLDNEPNILAEDAMITNYGKVALNTKGQDHLVMERKKDNGQIERKVACGIKHKNWQFFGDEWFDQEYEAADKVLKSGVCGCKKCQRLIRENASQFN